MTANTLKLFEVPKVADASRSIRHVFIRDLVVNCSIGIHGHEKQAHQRVRINLDLAVDENGQAINDDIDNVLCYEKLADGVGKIIGRGHVNLVETLAEDISGMCLKDARVLSARVRVEKLDILEGAQSVGVEIERFNSEV
ncbi:MAG: dihydroneopterin aldolase [Rhodospirillales bacterium]|nr:dihydroneopterin aldolase [Alphaproteobacteria bacterium]MBL6947584.1 dihydroneopterin aldolase [Rhodospirillales bacterium]